MSTCPKKSLYSAYVDGELPELWKKKLEVHTEECTECKEIIKSYKALKASMCLSYSGFPNLDESFQRLCKKRDDYICESKKRTITSWITKSVRVPVPVLIGAAILLFTITNIALLKQRDFENHVCAEALSRFKPILPVIHDKKNNSRAHLTNIALVNKEMFNNFDNNINNGQTIDGIAESFSEFVHLYLPRGEKDRGNIVIIRLPYSCSRGVYYNFSSFYDSDFYRFLNNAK